MSIEREDCSRCGGSGQIPREVAGRTGFVSCPECDNIPEYALPDDPPDDPRARLEEIEQEMTELRTEKRAWKVLRSDVWEARDLLELAADDDLIPEETGVKLEHICQQIQMVMRPLDGFDHSISHQKEQLGEEREKLKTYLHHVEKEELLAGAAEAIEAITDVADRWEVSPDEAEAFLEGAGYLPRHPMEETDD